MESYRFQVGAIHCMVIADMIEPLAEDRIQRIFGSSTDRMLAALRALPDPQQNCYNVLYLETGGKRVLVDTGIGQLNPDRPGRLITLLRAEGIEPEMIDTVIVTHFHPDHIGGMIDQDGGQTFPKARVVTRDVEYNYWMDEALLSTLDSNRAEIIRRVFAVYTPDLAKADDEVEPGVCLVAAPGHTPGQSALLIESQEDRLLHIADVFHMVMQLNAPECIPSFDSLPDVGIATRRAIFERAENERLLILAHHLSFPGLGYIQRTGIGQRIWTTYRNRQDVPDYLHETYDLLHCAYPNRIPEEDYWSVMALIHPYMSFRAIKRVLAALTDKSPAEVYNDASGFGSDPMPDPGDVEKVKQKLDACGYQAWVDESPV